MSNWDILHDMEEETKMSDFKPSGNLEPNFDQSIEFLQKWKPQGPWILTSLPVDSQQYSDNENVLRYTCTETFEKDELDKLKDWLQLRNGRCGIYFQVNSPIMLDEDGNPRKIRKKTLKTDIRSMDGFHLDIDPEAGKDLNAERKRAYDILMQPSGGIPKPTAVIFSGGGFQGFWKLAEPIVVNGDLGKCEKAEAYNIQIRETLGGDECHNIDRIMRLPGCINVPSTKKIQKGRSATLAELVYFDEDQVYGLEKFVPAQTVQRNDGSLHQNTVRISGNVERVTDLGGITTEEGTPIGLKASTIDLIQNGYDESQQAVNEARNLDRHYESRSEALFAVVCEMVKKRVPDEVIYSIITDPNYLISAHILEKRGGSEKSALRQIERAKDFVIRPELEELNSKHAVVLNHGGKCVIITERFDHSLGRTVLDKSRRQDIEDRYGNRDLVVAVDDNGRERREKLGKWWFEHPRRREYESIVMSPEKEIQGCYNLWKGFSYSPKMGDCSKFLDHVKINLCNNNTKHYDYLMNWLARMIQKPASQGEVAVVLQGEQGTGKTFFVDTIGKLLGRHYLIVSDPEHLLGRFNEHLQDSILVFSDEAFFAGNPKHQSVLKSLITGNNLVVEAKYERTRTAKNYVHLILASNSEHVVPADLDERRFFCLKVGNEQKQNPSYFQDILKQLEEGGYEALLYYLMKRDISKFIVQEVPQTDLLRSQKVITMNTENDWWYGILDDGINYGRGWSTNVPKEHLYNEYIAYCDQLKTRSKRKTKSEFKLFLEKVCPPNFPELGRLRQSNGHVRSYKFPSLNECREYYDETFHGPYPWNEAVGSICEDLTPSEPF